MVKNIRKKSIIKNKYKNSIFITNINTFGIARKNIRSYTYFNYNKKGHILRNYLELKKNILKNK